MRDDGFSELQPRPETVPQLRRSPWPRVAIDEKDNKAPEKARWVDPRKTSTEK